MGYRMPHLDGRVRTVVAAVIVLLPLLVTRPPSADSAPGGGTQVLQFRSTSEYASGMFEDAKEPTGFSAQAYDDPGGVPQGSVSAWVYSPPSASAYIMCAGPAYAQVVSVDQRTGTTRIYATLDPADDNCQSINVTTVMQVDVTGQFNGTARFSGHGAGTQTFLGVTFKINSQYDSFSQTFTGTNGFSAGPFTGDSSVERRVDRTRVK